LTSTLTIHSLFVGGEGGKKKKKKRGMSLSEKKERRGIAHRPPVEISLRSKIVPRPEEKGREGGKGRKGGKRTSLPVANRQRKREGEGKGGAAFGPLTNQEDFRSGDELSLLSNFGTGEKEKEKKGVK